MLKDKVIVITGASGGIGAEMAELFAKHGAITIIMARSADKLAQLAEKLPGTVDFFTLDVTSTEQVFETMEQVVLRYGKIDILINNAGYATFERLLDAPIEHYEQMMDVNYMGIVRTTKAVLPHMLAAGKGHIVNIASLAGKIGTIKSTAYSASKHAVLGFTNSLRPELANTGIYISAVNPGPVDTPFISKADPSGNYVSQVKRFMIKPERVAKAVLDTVIHKRTHVDVPLWFGFGAKLFHLFPNTFEKFTYNLLNKK